MEVQFGTPLIDSLRGKPGTLLHCRHPSNGGDRDDAPRLFMTELASNDYYGNFCYNV